MTIEKITTEKIGAASLAVGMTAPTRHERAGEQREAADQDERADDHLLRFEHEPGQVELGNRQLAAGRTGSR